MGRGEEVGELQESREGGKGEKYSGFGELCSSLWEKIQFRYRVCINNFVLFLVKTKAIST